MMPPILKSPYFSITWATRLALMRAAFCRSSYAFVHNISPVDLLLREPVRRVTREQKHLQTQVAEFVAPAEGGTKQHHWSESGLSLA